jgi:hypothetical protein
MSSLISPRLLRGGLVLVAPDSGAVQRVIVLQYNPDTLTRTLQPQSVGAESGDRLDVLRLKGPPVETIKFEAEIDATDQLEFPDRNPNTLQFGIEPLLAALETIVYPSSTSIQTNQGLAAAGTLELTPAETPLLLFVWSKNRIVPVRIADFSITEEAFDPNLNPIRAKVSLSLRVLSVNDFPPNHRGSSIYMAYQQQKERFAGLSQGALAALGIRSIFP